MTPLQYFLYANLYILAFWLGYRLWLKNLVYFRSIRIYLNLSVALSLILPFIQTGLADLIASNGMVSFSQDVPVIGIMYKYQIGQPFAASPGLSFNWIRLIEVILLSGGFVTALIYLFNHFRIKSVIKSSDRYLEIEHGLKVVKSDNITIPFIYFNRIVVPDSINDNDLHHVIRHELMHYRNGHYLDNLLFSILHLIFWANPFFLLLRRALKLNHEFQVDDQMLSTGVDPVSYKLSLIKYSVGHNLYSLANGLSTTNTKTRLLMINKIHIKDGKWRFILLLPTLAILFILFCFADIEPNIPATQSKALIDTRQDDSVVVEFLNHFKVPEGGDAPRPLKGVISVLMNRNSDFMIAGEVQDLQNVEQTIISLYNKKLAEENDQNAGNYPDNTDLGIKIVVKKDMTASIDEYQKLIAQITTALLKVREMQSIRLFGGTFETLTSSDKEVINKLVPLRIYGVKPDKHMGQ